jgi:hypothetical protein
MAKSGARVRLSRRERQPVSSEGFPGSFGISGHPRPDEPGDGTQLLEAAPDAYARFDRRDDGWTKVLLKPGSQAA